MQDLTQAGRPLDATSATYVERLRVPWMSVGTYTIPAGAPDPQAPHREDEVYLVTVGRGRLWTPASTVDVGPGSILFVPAGEQHRFVDVTDDLTVVVLFAPAETRPSTGRAGASTPSSPTGTAPG